MGRGGEFGASCLTHRGRGASLLFSAASLIARHWAIEVGVSLRARLAPPHSTLCRALSRELGFLRISPLLVYTMTGRKKQ